MNNQVSTLHAQTLGSTQPSTPMVHQHYPDVFLTVIVYFFMWLQFYLRIRPEFIFHQDLENRKSENQAQWMRCLCSQGPVIPTSTNLLLSLGQITLYPKPRNIGPCKYAVRMTPNGESMPAVLDCLCLALLWLLYFLGSLLSF